MSEAPSIFASAAAGAAAIIVAAIQRGAAAGLDELRKEMVEVKAKLKTLEALPGEWAAAKAETTRFINAEVQAAKQSIDNRLRRQATGSQPSLHSMDDLARTLGMEDLARRVKTLEEQHEADQRAALELQRELGKLTAMLELLLGGKIKS